MPKGSWARGFGSPVAKSILIGCAAAACTATAFAQGLETLVPFVPEAPVMDGNLEEWPSEPLLRLTRSEQVWRSAERGGWGRVGAGRMSA